MNDVETIQLENSRFTTNILVEDPVTSTELEIECEIDTGNPDALALPKKLASNFTHFVGHRTRGGAGTGESEAYAVEFKKIGSVEVSHKNIAVMSLPNRYEFGLVGAELLRYALLIIYDPPDDKKMDIETKYFSK